MSDQRAKRAKPAPGGPPAKGGAGSGMAEPQAPREGQQQPQQQQPPPPRGASGAARGDAARAAAGGAARPPPPPRPVPAHGYAAAPAPAALFTPPAPRAPGGAFSSAAQGGTPGGATPGSATPFAVRFQARAARGCVPLLQRRVRMCAVQRRACWRASGRATRRGEGGPRARAR